MIKVLTLCSSCWSACELQNYLFINVSGKKMGRYWRIKKKISYHFKSHSLRHDFLDSSKSSTATVAKSATSCATARATPTSATTCGASCRRGTTAPFLKRNRNKLIQKKYLNTEKLINSLCALWFFHALYSVHFFLTLIFLDRNVFKSLNFLWLLRLWLISKGSLVYPGSLNFTGSLVYPGSLNCQGFLTHYRPARPFGKRKKIF